MTLLLLCMSSVHYVFLGQHTCCGMGRSYGVAYWHARFPDWPLKIRCCKGPVSRDMLLSNNLNDTWWRCAAAGLLYMHFVA